MSASSLLSLAAYIPRGKPRGLSPQAVRQRLNRLPILCDFETAWELPFVEPDSRLKLVVEPPPIGFQAASGQVGKVVFEAGEPSGFELKGFSGDWSGYDCLGFDVFSDQDEPVQLKLCVHDRHHSNRFSDRFNTSLQIAPGSMKTSIALEDVRRGPDARTMDMTAIDWVIVFTNVPTHPLTLHFENLQLR